MKGVDFSFNLGTFQVIIAFSMKPEKIDDTIRIKYQSKLFSTWKFYLDKTSMVSDISDNNNEITFDNANILSFKFMYYKLFI